MTTTVIRYRKRGGEGSFFLVFFFVKGGAQNVLLRVKYVDARRHFFPRFDESANDATDVG